MAPSLLREPVVVPANRIVHLNQPIDLNQSDASSSIHGGGGDLQDEYTWLGNSIQALAVSEIDTTEHDVLNGLQSAKWPKDALDLFHRVQQSGQFKHNRRTYGKMIEILSSNGVSIDKATQIFLDMPSVSGVPWDEDLLAIVIKGHSFGVYRCEDVCIRLFDRMKDAGVVRTSRPYDALLYVLLNRKRCTVAKTYFHQMLTDGIEPTRETYRIMITGLFSSKMSKTAEEYFRMVKEPDASIYNSMIKGYNYMGKVEKAEGMFAKMIATGVAPNAATYTAMIRMYVTNDGRLNDALSMYQEMKSANIEPTEDTYILVLDGLCKGRCILEAISLLLEMEEKQIRPIYLKYIYLNLMTYLCESGMVDVAVTLLRAMHKASLPMGVAHYAILINTFCTAGAYDTAVEFFDQLMEKDLIAKSDSYNDYETIAFSPIISYFCNHRQTAKAEKLFRLLVEERGAAYDDFFNELVLGYAREGSPEQASHLFRFMDTMGYHHS